MIRGQLVGVAWAFGLAAVSVVGLTIVGAPDWAKWAVGYLVGLNVLFHWDPNA